MTVLIPESRRAFRRKLLQWFDGNRRELPWRAGRDPYHVWLSEIMLQQTRVAVVRERYPELLNRFPTVEELAAAELPQVLAAWSGLGYYRRARALHDAARQIVVAGFPRTAEEWSALPGIGRYTAAAIASIAFGQACAVVDGNVERVLTRLFRLRGGQTWEVAGELLSRRRPGDFNQAMMELGATICLPRAPVCKQCPVFAWCGTRGAAPARPHSSRRKAQIAYALAVRNRAVFLVQREKHHSLMPGMWELPGADGSISSTPALRLRHAITVTDYDVSVYRAKRVNSKGRWVKLADVQRLPLTGLTLKILRHSSLI